MKKVLITLMALMLTALGVSGASAVNFDLSEWATYKDGVISDNLPDPNESFSSKSFSLTFNTPGNHTGIVFVDSEIDQTINTFFNEYGAVHGSPAAGQSWEIDEPGWEFGNIYDNFTTGSLDGTIFDGSFLGPEDIAMALGWDFILNSGETATLAFALNANKPSSGFYLEQIDPDSNASLYYSSTLKIESDGGGGGGTPVPEPSTFVLFGSAMAGLAFFFRNRNRRL